MVEPPPQDSERALDEDTDDAPATPRQMRIVGIGASAGGLESLEKFFGRLASDTGDAFVVVQHLSPDFKSLMDELLARHSAMPIEVVEDGVEVKPDHVYLMPPRKEISIEGGRLRLTDKDPEASFTRPIDSFLSSLAQDVGRRSVAVVLSGSGSDGARGIVDIRQAGGWVLVESPDSAQFDGMPRSAIATSVVHEVGRPEALADLVMGIAEAPTTSHELSTPLQRIFRRLNAAYGIDFSTYKEATIERRIERRLQLLEEAELEDYADRIDEDADERSELYSDLLIGVTQFFRDPAAFEVIEKQVIPELLDRVPPEDEIRFWVAGCATGEEAYSLAMLLVEQLEARGRSIHAKILATDVHRRSLDFAGRGLYSEARLEHVGPSRLERFFERRPGGYQVKAELRKLLVFAPHNVARDAPFTKLHLIACRNLLIYLNTAAQKSVLSLFHFGLITGGVLFLGSSETPGALSGEFTAINERRRVFRKRRAVRLLDHVRLPALPERPLSGQGFTVPPGTDTQLLGLYDRLLDRHMPPSYLLDNDGMLIDSFGGAERYLEVKGRRPSQMLVDMLRSDVRMFVSAGLAHVCKDHGIARYERVDLPDGSGQCTLTVESLRNPRTEAQHFLVSIVDSRARPEPVAASEDGAPPAPRDPGDVSQERVAALEEELSLSKEKLQATIEELETSNEELQAANEELVASNEELQSTNEELHSVNEELYTVNAENQRKIEELRQLTGDVQNLLDGASIGTLLLDSRLRIRKFTSHIARLFNIIASDIGRSITNFSHGIQYEPLFEDLQRVLDGGVPVETEVREADGTPFFMRILPYLAPVDDDVERAGAPRPIDGVVMTLTDISPIEDIRGQLAELSSIVASSDDAIIGVDVNRKITSWNRGATRLYGYDEDEVLGRDFLFLVPQEDQEAAQQLMANALEGEVSDPLRTRRRCKDGSRVHVSVTVSVKRGPGGEVVGASSIARDIGDQVRAEEELRTAAERREHFLAMLSHELRNPIAAVLHAASLVALDEVPASQKDAAVGVISRQTRHMARLLEDLLDVSRITRGQFSLQRESVDLRDVLDSVLESMEPFRRSNDAAVDVQMAETPVPIFGDAARLHQVAANLLSNALRYSPQGSHVRVTLEKMGNTAILRVVDQGRGIDDSLMPKIFDLFVQSDQAIDRREGGLGVGLTLVREIVRAHGGSVAAHSDGEGKGSEFVVRLPLCDPAELEEGAGAAESGTFSQTKRIVVVEDQEDARQMLELLLESRGHTVVSAEDGPAGLEAITKHRPDVALVDLGLPTMSGFEVAREVRRRLGSNHVLLVALSGYGASEDVEKAIDAGFDAHITKPADPERLEELLSRD